MNEKFVSDKRKKRKKRKETLDSLSLSILKWLIYNHRKHKSFLPY